MRLKGYKHWMSQIKLNVCKYRVDSNLLIAYHYAVNPCYNQKSTFLHGEKSRSTKSVTPKQRQQNPLGAPGKVSVGMGGNGIDNLPETNASRPWKSMVGSFLWSLSIFRCDLLVSRSVCDLIGSIWMSTGRKEVPHIMRNVRKTILFQWVILISLVQKIWTQQKTQGQTDHLL